MGYESLNIGVESVARLHMGLGKGLEEDEIFKRELAFEHGSTEKKMIEGSLKVSLLFPLQLSVGS